MFAAILFSGIAFSEVMCGWSNAFVNPPPPEMVLADKQFSSKIEFHRNNSQLFDVPCLKLVLGQFHDSVCGSVIAEAVSSSHTQ